MKLVATVAGETLEGRVQNVMARLFSNEFGWLRLSWAGKKSKEDIASGIEKVVVKNTSLFIFITGDFFFQIKSIFFLFNLIIFF